MNWLSKTDREILKIAVPIMDNLMQATKEMDHNKHIKNFSEKMKTSVTKEQFDQQCADYQNSRGYVTKRHIVGILKKRNDVRVLWKLWYSKSEDEYLAFIHLNKQHDNILVIGVSIT